MPNAPDPLDHHLDEGDDRRICQVVDLYLGNHPPIAGYDAEDLYQEGRMAWYRAQDTYRPDRGASRFTYIGRVVEHRLSDLARQARAIRRGSGRREISLDLPVSDDGDALASLIQDDAPLPHDAAESGELLDLLERVRQALPARQRRIFDAMAEAPERPRTQLAREAGVSRDTLYEDIRRIREVCRDEGLEEFLR